MLFPLGIDGNHAFLVDLQRGGGYIKCRRVPGLVWTGFKEDSRAPPFRFDPWLKRWIFPFNPVTSEAGSGKRAVREERKKTRVGLSSISITTTYLPTICIPRHARTQATVYHIGSSFSNFLSRPASFPHITCRKQVFGVAGRGVWRPAHQSRERQQGAGWRLRRRL